MAKVQIACGTRSKTGSKLWHGTTLTWTALAGNSSFEQEMMER